LRTLTNKVHGQLKKKVTSVYKI